MFTPSQRSQVPPFLVMDVMEAADQMERAGHQVLHLEVGQPETPAPRSVREAAHRAIDTDRLGYSRATGIAPLREKIAEHYDKSYGVRVPADRIVITQGASGAFVLAFLAAFDEGEQVALTVPGYPCYPNILRSLNLEPVPLRVGPDTGYLLGVEHLQTLESKPSGLIVASPANPTGSMYSPGHLRALLSYCKSQGIFAIVDEIYHGLEFAGERTSTAAEFADSTIVVGSFSKYFSMTGWRLGWMIVPETLVRTVEILSQNLTICAPTLSQIAAIEAFDAEEELQKHVARYRRNRDVLLRALSEAGVTHIAPADGAFYIYADVSDFTDDSQKLCAEMLSEVQVAATAGIDFDPEQGKKMVRFSYCRSEEVIFEAAQRIREFLGARRGFLHEPV